MKFNSCRGVRNLAMVVALLAVWSVVLASPVMAAGPTIIADHSLTPKEYADMGLPAIDKPWSADEYTQAGKVMQELFQKDPTQLPRLDSPKSGAVFARFVSPENIPSTTDKSTPVDQRLSAAGALLQAAVPLFYAYGKKTDAGESFDSESLKFGAFLLRAEIAAAVLGDEKVAGTAVGAPSVAASVEQIKSGIVQTAGGLIDMLTDHSSIRTEQAVRSANEFKALFVQAYPELLPEGKTKLHKVLSDAIEKETDPAIKTALQAITAALPAN